MKKFIITSVLAATTVYVHAQGTIEVYNTTAAVATEISTAAYSAAGTATGGTLTKTPTSGSFDYVLLAEPYNASLNGTVPALSTLESLQVAVSGITNYGTTGGIGGPGHGLGSTVQIAGWTPPQNSFTDGTGVEYSYVLVGWDAALGSTWSAVETDLANPAYYNVGNVFGSSVFGGGYTGGGLIPAPSIFGQSTGEPNGITTSPVLYGVVTVPEPTTIALGVMGVASLLALRRKKA